MKFENKLYQTIFDIASSYDWRIKAMSYDELRKELETKGFHTNGSTPAAENRGLARRCSAMYDLAARVDDKEAMAVIKMAFVNGTGRYSFWPTLTREEAVTKCEAELANGKVSAPPPPKSKFPNLPPTPRFQLLTSEATLQELNPLIEMLASQKLKFELTVAI